MIKIPKKHFKWVFLQRSILEIIYKLDSRTATEAEVSEAVTEDFTRDFNTIVKELPDNPKDVLDIGGGVGILDILISEYYDHNVNIHIVDKDDFKLNHNFRMINYGPESNMGAYNDFNATYEIMEMNGVPKKNIHLYDVDKGEFPEIKMDTILSITSWGWHFPLSVYANQINLKHGGALILDHRLDIERDEPEEIKLIDDQFGGRKSCYTHFGYHEPDLKKGERWVWTNI